MDIEILLNNILQTILLPPGLSIAMIIVGLVLISRYYATGKILLLLGFSLLIILSLPIAAQGLNQLLEQDKALTISELKNSKAKVIIVLGAGRYKNAIEYEDQTDSISANALARLSYAAYLHKKTKIPMLLSGGSPRGEMLSEATIMQTALNNKFQLKAKWLDKNSSNTWNNAKYSSEILKPLQIENIILVTHAVHLPRARMAFEHFGLKVTAAPLGFRARNKKEDDYTILDVLPSAHAMSSSSAALHEFIGYIWYRVRYKGLW